MEVYLVGPTISIEVSTPPAHVRDCKGGEPPTTTAANGGRNPCTCTCSFPSLLMNDGEREKSEFQPAVSPDRDISETESSSSIGSPTDDEEEGDESEEVQSKFVGSLSSLNSLEESLPIKRGLSNHFTGKSKSFANLADASSAKDLEKQESPFNKRRRTLIQYKLGRKSCFYSWSDPKSMPLLALREEEEEEEDEDEDEDEDEEDEEEGKREEIRRSKVNEIGRRKLRSFKSSGRSFLSLTDLQG